MKISKRDRLALIVLGFILITVLYAMLVWLPLQNEYNQAYAELDAARQELAALQQQSALVSSERDRIHDLLAQTRESLSSIPEAIDTAELLLIFRELADENGLMELSEQYDNIPGGSDIIHTQTVRLSFTGTYAALDAFLRDMQELEILNRVTEADMSYSPDSRLWQVSLIVELGYSSAMSEPGE